MAATPKTNPKSSPTTAQSLTTAAAIAAAAAASISPSPPPSPSPSPPPPPPHTPATARRRPPGRTAAAAVIADPLSDKATILLIRRTLCADDVGQPAALGHGQPPAPVSTAAQPQALTPTPTPTPTATATTSTISIAPTTSIPTTTTSATPPPQTPIEELLPPLTSRNDVDLQLYALLAVVVREFVQTWYCRITTDSQLATEIVHIFAHCTRALEQRLRKADLEGLVFDELPALLDNHVQAYRIAHQRLVPLPVQTDPRVVYHALLPLPALEPVPSAKSAESVLSQAANESAYRQLLVSGLLAVLLPTEDLENECLTSLLSQILSELLLGNVLAGRVAEPWMMWEIVGMLARLLREKIDGENNNTLPNSTTKLPQKLRSPSLTPPPTPSPSSFSALSSSISLRFSSFSSTITPLFWSALRIGFALYASLRFLVASISLARSLPPRQLQFSDQSMPAKNSSLPVAHSAAHLLPSPPPVLAYSLWPAVANLVEFNVRMPWLSGCLSMVQWLALTGPGRIGAFDGPLDSIDVDETEEQLIQSVSSSLAYLWSTASAFWANRISEKPFWLPIAQYPPQQHPTNRSRLRAQI
ncbi:pxa domain containing protein [Grosmannia clavigera kw1407]|uniref:Pxa domain containing protein n=1 Tax=Grosmannia clavigera (strain kw1407 / UAMH 11150) TaxID=655863 RepID=F0XPT5_GROCL|nr:pxa domain containing protein [Grosmannia clavigera kw1407]EFX00238.1 pxa domain containing protein [Grosmannia clavigera kw1407]